MGDDVKVGMIVRSDQGGLGNQTHEIWRHVRPDVTVNVNFSRLPDAMPQGYWRYPGAVETTWKGVGFPFDHRGAFQLLLTCDVIFSVETFYDLRLMQHPQAPPGVLYVNPELFRGYGAPTYWAPTPWLVDELPAGTRVVPFPVATDRPYKKGRGFMHVGGRNTSFDRNGTRAAARAVRHTGELLQLTHQVDMPTMQGAVQLGTVEHYWDAYAHGDVLVMPRRYGGMSLPVQEALAAGLTVVMTDQSPNEQWPVMLVDGNVSTVRTVAKFPIPAMDADHDALVAACRDARDWGRDNAQAQADWVEAHSWDTLLPVWQAALEDAANSR